MVAISLTMDLAKLTIKELLAVDTVTNPGSTSPSWDQTSISQCIPPCCCEGEAVTEATTQLIVGADALDSDSSLSTLELYPQSGIESNSSLHIGGLDIKGDASFFLGASDETDVCGYSLDINDLNSGYLHMESNSRLVLACPSTIVANQVTLADVTFDSKAAESGSYQVPSYIETPALNVIGITNAGLLNLYASLAYDITIGINGIFWFQPVSPDFTFREISVEGSLTASRPLHFDCTILSIGSAGIVQWHGTVDSVLECHNVHVDGSLYPGDRVDFGRGINTFEVSSTGTVTFTPTLTPLKTEIVSIDGEVNILAPLSITPYDDALEYVRQLLVGPNGIIHADRLNIGAEGIGMLTVRGTLTFTSDGDYPLHETNIYGRLDCRNRLSIHGIRNDSYLQTLDGSQVTVNSAAEGDLSNALYVELNTISIDGSFRVIGRADAEVYTSFTVDDNGYFFIDDQRNSTLEPSSIDTGLLTVNGELFGSTLGITVEEDFVVGPLGVLSVSDGGYLSDNGPGAGTASSSGASGASHGGRGGHGQGDSILAEVPYGSIYTPGIRGSGGGSGTTTPSGGRGGGYLRAVVQSTITVNGQIWANGQNAEGSHAGGGSGGSVWVSCDHFQGTGRVYADGGSGQGNGGGGSGGRVLIQCSTLTFEDENIGAAGGLGGNVGGPGLIYIEALETRLLRVENKCRMPQVTFPSSSMDRALEESYYQFTLSGGIALLGDSRVQHDFTAIRINGSAHLAFMGNDTVVNAGNIYGDDTGHIHVGPTQTLNITDTWAYKYQKVNWAPVIYEKATLALPEATVEVRQPFDWKTLSVNRPYPCPVSNLRESGVTIWGTLEGRKAHLLVGTGCQLRMAVPSHSELEFAALTVQDGGVFQVDSLYNMTQDARNIKVWPFEGECHACKTGTVTIEGGGILSARALTLDTYSLVVDSQGTVTASGQGLIDGPGYHGDDTSGAGHGGIGGRGSGQEAHVGVTYGSVRQPAEFGSGTGGSNGAGGGVLRFIVETVLEVEGTLRADGNGAAGGPGCSGGSIWITSQELKGSGIIMVNGGQGWSSSLGGGGGGRLAVYYKTLDWWFGEFQAYGGSASNQRNGGAGTVYLEDQSIGRQNQTLYMNNNGQLPPSEVIASYDLVSLDSSRTWLSDHDSNMTFDIDTLTLIGSSHMALDPSIHQFQAKILVGDQQSYLHVGPGQVFIISVPEWEELEANIHVYEGGILLLPPEVTCYNIDIIGNH
nr:uncharacterized protein LOC129265182 [Lytechinus pictus]